MRAYVKTEFGGCRVKVNFKITFDKCGFKASF